MNQCRKPLQNEAKQLRAATFAIIILREKYISNFERKNVFGAAYFFRRLYNISSKIKIIVLFKSIRNGKRRNKGNFTSKSN